MKIIKLILNWLIVFAVIFFGSKIAPTKIFMESWKDAAILAVIIGFVNIVVGFIVFGLIAGTSLFSNNSLLIGSIFIIGFVFLLLLDPIVLYFACKWVNGVTITGFWTYVLMGIVISILKSGLSSSNKNDD